MGLHLQVSIGLSPFHLIAETHLILRKTSAHLDPSPYRSRTSMGPLLDGTFRRAPPVFLMTVLRPSLDLEFPPAPTSEVRGRSVDIVSCAERHRACFRLEMAYRAI